jgi:hypothetical protein
MSTKIRVIPSEDQTAIQVQSTNQGPPGPGGSGGGTSFLDSPDELDENSPNYLYFGWVLVGTNWLIRRQSRLTSRTQDATNPVGLFATAWGNRHSLTYL